MSDCGWALFLLLLLRVLLHEKAVERYAGHAAVHS
jgi:hypothetical protein